MDSSSDLQKVAEEPAHRGTCLQGYLPAGGRGERQGRVAVKGAGGGAGQTEETLTQLAADAVAWQVAGLLCILFSSLEK